ncbi:hypothetical protein [Dactylosporangium sp. NPDC049140]|uniref:hypothetical protein n=1 Tax=Dactylosporangium sp. NPDC049140 TaxID=3155647 RepID=UPI0033C53943
MRNPFTRTNLSLRLRDARDMGWFNLLPTALIALAALGAWLLLSRATDMFRTQGPGGIEGTVSITNCDPLDGRREAGWTCDGTFVSNDGTLRIGQVHLFPYFPERPTGPVPARVTSRTSDTAAAGSTAGWVWAVPLVGGLAFAGLTSYFVYSFYLQPEPPESPKAQKARRRREQAKQQHDGRANGSRRARRR